MVPLELYLGRATREGRSACRRPCVNRRPRLECEIPLLILKLGHRFENRRISFNESPWTRGPVAVDPVYGPWTYSIGFAIEK
jgi:hypothetical protein